MMLPRIVRLQSLLPMQKQTAPTCGQLNLPARWFKDRSGIDAITNKRVIVVGRASLGVKWSLYFGLTMSPVYTASKERVQPGML